MLIVMRSLVWGLKYEWVSQLLTVGLVRTVRSH